MGIDAKVILPGNVELGNVSKVIGAVLGCPRRREDFTPHEGWCARVGNLRVRQIEGLPEMVEIVVEGVRMVDGSTRWSCNYHFEAPEGGGLLSARSTALWLAVGRRLVDFFGGSLDHQDWDSVRADYSAPAKPDGENRPQDGGPWLALQQRILGIDPLTKAEWRCMGRHAASTLRQTRGTRSRNSRIAESHETVDAEGGSAAPQRRLSAFGGAGRGGVGGNRSQVVCRSTQSE